MDKWKIAIEINLMKLLIVAGMALCTWMAIVCGEGETLLIIIPAGIAYLFRKDV